MPTLQHLLSGALCALVVAAGACGDDAPTTLFEEKGTWALFQHDVDGKGTMPIDLPERVDKFLLNYDPETEIVSAASCLDSMGRTGVLESLCDLDKFVCRCFKYTFEEEKMTWTEFSPDGPPEGYMTPPEPEEGSAALKPGDPINIEVSEYPESNGTYRYSRLPFGLFSSDGVISKYVFQIRGNSLFAPTGCLEVCGATPPAPEM